MIFIDIAKRDAENLIISVRIYSMLFFCKDIFTILIMKQLWISDHEKMMIDWNSFKRTAFNWCYKKKMG